MRIRNRASGSKKEERGRESECRVSEVQSWENKLKFPAPKCAPESEVCLNLADRTDNVMSGASRKLRLLAGKTSRLDAAGLSLCDHSTTHI